jgi:hypothetical protein
MKTHITFSTTLNLKIPKVITDTGNLHSMVDILQENKKWGLTKPPRYDIINLTKGKEVTK